MAEVLFHFDDSTLQNFVLWDNDNNTSPYVLDNRILYKTLTQNDRVMGVITRRTYKNAFNRINQSPLNKGEKRKCMDRFDRIMNVIQIREVDLVDYEKTKSDVREFYKDYVSRRPDFGVNRHLRMENIARPFKETVLGSVFNNCEKSFHTSPEENDVKILSEMILNKDEKKTNLISSLDRHFLDDGIRQAIEDKYGLFPRYPRELTAVILGQGVYLPIASNARLCR